MKRMIIRSVKPTIQCGARSTTYNKRISITYGTVHSNNKGTTNILLSTGFIAENIRIPSSYYPSIDPVIGGIAYPPKGTEVVILHPENDFSSGFILPVADTICVISRFSTVSV